MNFRNVIRRIYKAKDFSVLALAAFTSVATSLAEEGLENGTYKVVSDCPNATKVGQLVWGLYYDMGQNAVVFGFPNGTFRKSSSNTILIEDDKRMCKAVVFSDQKKFALFICTDLEEKNVECTISLEAL